MKKITKVSAREILDSRGNPTLEAEVMLDDGTVGVGSVPSGASTGRYEAHELRDRDAKRFHGMGMLSAIKNVNEKIYPALLGLDISDLDEIDSVMIALDGMHNKSNLGANAILATSIAALRAGALAYSLPLYRYLGGALVNRLPVPMMNILNGGAHAENNVEIQEFMIIPSGFQSFSEAVRASSEVYRTLKNILSAERLSSGVGDEGGFAPMLDSDEDAIKLIIRAIEKTGYKAGDDFTLGLDVAASEWWCDGEYYLKKRKQRMTSDELCSYISSLVSSYPILSVEDGAGEDDVYAWQRLTDKLSGSVMLVGDDLFVTNKERIENGIRQKIANAVLIKPNQIGSVTDTRDAVICARNANYKSIMSHRSADTEDSFIADFAVGLGCGFIKTGAPARAERTAKYNRLLKIESEIFMPIYG